MSDAQMDMSVDADVSEVLRRPSRLRALTELAANAESSAEALDRIAGIACRVLDVRVVLVNLVGADRQRFVGCGGPEEPWASMRELPLTHGFCPFALGADDAYTLDDARADSTLAANPAVVQLGVVAYAGVPLRGPDGEPVGTLCAIDYRPREWSPDDLALLSDLAASVIAELQLLAATRSAARQQSRVRALTALSSALGPARAAGDMLEEVARAVDRLDANAIWLLMLDQSGQTLRTAATHGADNDEAAPQPHMPLDSALAPAHAVRTGEADFLPTRADVRDRFGPILDVVSDIRSLAVLPLTAGEQHLGVLVVSFADERAFGTDDRDYLAALASVSALALTGTSIEVV